MIRPGKIFISSILLFIFFNSVAQINPIDLGGKQAFSASNDTINKLVIAGISITGNIKTKELVILKETPFKVGDSLKENEIFKIFQQARQQIYNSTLFLEVKISYQLISEKHILINIAVKERWYIYPIPQFHLVDRNFNDWYNTFHHSLNRVNYGVKFADYNLTGKHDQLRLFLINGYSRNVSATYSNPYFNKDLDKGFSVSAGYTQSREVGYNTSSANTVLFYPVDSILYRSNDFVRNGWFLSTTFLIRKGFLTKHYFTTSYTFLKADDSIIIKNRNYFKDSTNAKGLLDLSYSWQYINLDNNAYPLSGSSAFLTVVKRGWGFKGSLNMVSIESGFNKYISLGKEWYVSMLVAGKIKLPFDQAYINQRALGYGETYLRGFEYNVIDGVAYLLLKSTLKRKLFSFSIPFPFFPKQLTRIPFSFFAKTYADFGYVYNKPQYYTYLNNRILYSGGIGIDILTLYDINFRFEYSVNQLSKSGLFFHTQNGF